MDNIMPSEYWSDAMVSEDASVMFPEDTSIDGAGEGLRIHDLGSTKLIDCGQDFVTEQVFSTREDLIYWAREVGKNIGFVVVIYRSDMGGTGGNRRKFVTLGCERSGKYKENKNSLKREMTGTKKCECPFRLRGRPLANDEGWKLIVVCGYHNHERAEVLIGHPYPGRLKPHEKTLVADMTKNLVKPSSILLALKDHDPDNVSTIKTIYNERYAYGISIRWPRTEMQQLMKMLESDNYVYWYRRNETSDTVQDIFWAHPDSVKLFHTFHIVIVIDSTYKTNRYRLPLLEMVGVTSTDLTYSIAFAYLESERADNFVWALQKLRSLVLSDDRIPQVIVTDRDIALLNAVNEVFPTSRHLLCQFHIAKNVKARCKIMVAKKDLWDVVMNVWQFIVDSPTSEDYETRVANFQVVCKGFRTFFDYVMNTWLVPHKEKFVHAWIDNVMHLGNTTTNRVEGGHAKLKKLLRDSQGDFCKCWDSINNLIILQHNEIQSSFQQSMIVMEHRFNNKMYENLRGLVSRSALGKIHDEHQRINIVGIDSAACGCALRRTHGLPCACELARISTYCSSIPLHEVHSQWRRLSILEEPEIDTVPSEEASAMQNAVEALWRRYLQLDITGKDTLVHKVNELAFPDTTSMCPPAAKVRTKGALKGKSARKEKSTKRDPSYFEIVDSIVDSNPSVDNIRNSQSKRKKALLYSNDFPPEFLGYIDEVVDVVADGNCGYRVIAAQVGLEEGDWSIVRMQLYQEMIEHKSLYLDLFGSADRLHQIMSSTFVDSIVGTQPMDKWMTLPDMGYVIATKYQRVLVCLSKNCSSTFFPLVGSPA